MNFGDAAEKSRSCVSKICLNHKLRLVLLNFFYHYLIKIRFLDIWRIDSVLCIKSIYSYKYFVNEKVLHVFFGKRTY